MKYWKSLCIVLLLVACASVPGTGRRRFAPMLSLEEQLHLGQEAYVEALSEEREITSGPDYEMVRRIGERIAQSEYLAQLFPEQVELFEWEFKLIDNDQMANAWALPGGKCAVYTGLLPITQDEDGLAAVMGHEIAHAVAEHGAERMTHAQMLGAGMNLAEISLAETGSAYADEIMAALGLGANVGVMLPFSRAHESEADELGLFFAADAGYDPRAAVGLWERMAATGGDRPAEWLSTHPSEGSRIEHLKEIMPKALEYYHAAKAR